MVEHRGHMHIGVSVDPDGHDHLAVHATPSLTDEGVTGGSGDGTAQG
jgi:hypothetical protein